MAFNNLNFNSTVFYGLGWPTTFQFTIPSTYEMPAAGYIDIELNLTNLVPGTDSNIVTSNGKYYYRATSTGTKTMNLKTSGSQTASVSVELIHGDFAAASAAQTTRQYVSVAAQNVTFTGNRATGFYNNTVYCYSNSNYSTRIGSFSGTRTGFITYTYYNGAFTFTGIIDATATVYMRAQDNTYNYTASTTALNMYNGNVSCAVSRARR
jgi:hypothetical protein